MTSFDGLRQQPIDISCLLIGLDKDYADGKCRQVSERAASGGLQSRYAFNLTVDCYHELMQRFDTDPPPIRELAGAVAHYDVVALVEPPPSAAPSRVRAVRNRLDVALQIYREISSFDDPGDLDQRSPLWFVLHPDSDESEILSVRDTVVEARFGSVEILRLEPQPYAVAAWTTCDDISRSVGADLQRAFEMKISRR